MDPLPPAIQGFTAKVSEYAAGFQNVKNFDDFLELNKKVSGSPSLNMEKVGTGAAAGFVTGYAFRNTLKTALLFGGVSLVSLQALNHFGFINFNWKNIEKTARDAFDGTSDAVAHNAEIQNAIQKGRSLLTGGFAVGFLLGFRM